MAFETGMNMEKPDEGILKGRQEQVACDCWFTSSGRTIPRRIKFRDAQGGLQELTSIRVAYSEKKRYCGVSAMEYMCDTVIGGTKWIFKLIFYVEECKWAVLWGGSQEESPKHG